MNLALRFSPPELSYELFARLVQSQSLKHGDREGRHYYTTASQATALVYIVVATLAVAMLGCVAEKLVYRIIQGCVLVVIFLPGAVIVL